jgi:hypothetical protein
MKATKYQKKSQIRLEDLLRKRKTNLNQFIKDRGITTYEGLDTLCKRLGVLTPNQESFSLCVEKYVSNPAAGVVVIPPPVVLNESTGEPESDEDTFEDLHPQISITDEDASVVLKEASSTPPGALTKKQRKQMRKQQQTPDAN